MTAGVLSLPTAQQAYDLQMATTYYSAPYSPVADLSPAEQREATRADSDAVFATMIETFLAGLATREPATPARQRSGRPTKRSAR